MALMDLFAGTAAAANPYAAALQAGGAVVGGVAGLIGERRQRKERERYRREYLTSIAPTGEETALRGQLMSEAQRGLAGEIDPGLERFLERRRALRSIERGRGAEVRRGALARSLTRGGFAADDPIRAALAARGEIEEARGADEEALERERTLLAERGAARTTGRETLRSISAGLAADRAQRAAAIGGLGPETGGGELAAGGGALAQESLAGLLEMLRRRAPKQEAV